MTLTGALVRLEPLSHDHRPELLNLSADAGIWRYLTANASTPAKMGAYLDGLLCDYESGSALPFAIRTMSDGRVIGLTRLKNISREHRKAIVGSWLEESAWGTGANTEAKLLLLEYAFESLNCLRVEFQTDSRNLRSRAALARMGATEEGILRSYLITKDGHRRDSVIFSILDSEWPVVKLGLYARLERQMGALLRENRRTSKND